MLSVGDSTPGCVMVRMENALRVAKWAIFGGSAFKVRDDLNKDLLIYLALNLSFPQLAEHLSRQQEGVV